MSQYDANAEAQLVGSFSDTGNAEADEVSNRTGGGYSESDATRETGASMRDTARSWHDARNDYEEDEGQDRRQSNWF